MITVLLGPQRFRMTAGTVVREIAHEGPVATVTAGWRDRESDTAELDRVLDGRGRHLHLYGRLTDVIQTDQRFAEASLTYRDAVDELARIYSLRLQSALESVYAVQRRTVRVDLAATALSDGVRVVQGIDRWYLETLNQLQEELRTSAQPDRSEPIQRHRADVAEALDQAAVLVIAGGHVGLLLQCLKLFEVQPSHVLPVVAWSAGAMSLTERVVLYNDTGLSGVIGSEVWDRGLGRVSGIVAMPHARRRLRMDDPAILRVLARRFGDARCLLLDDGARVDLGPSGELPGGARVIGDDGLVHTVAGAS
ncbi:MAG TPA: hypothetical protein VFP34_13720 [Microlunatus sp.]|nr:hypothetical protein [Microlunatus sp.]